MGFYQSLYYPSGGARDLLLCSNYIEEVEVAIELKELDERYTDTPWQYCHAHIYDCETGEIVKEYDED